MKVVDNSQEHFRIQHWKQNARLWTFALAITTLFLFIIQYIYPRTYLSCVQHPTQHKNQPPRRQTEEGPVELQQEPKQKMGSNREHNMEFFDPDGSQAPSEDVDCKFDRWLWSTNPVEDGYLFKHEKDSFELVNVELSREKIDGYSRSSIYEHSSSLSTRKKKDFQRTPSKEWYNVYLHGQTPKRSYRLGTYSSPERAREIYDRVEIFLENTKIITDSPLRLQLNDDSRAWVWVVIIVNFCILVYFLQRPAFEEFIFDRKHSTVVLSQKNIVGYVRQTRTSTLEYICKARAKRLHVYAVENRFDFRIRDCPKYVVEVVASDGYGQEEVIRLGLDDLLDNADEAKNISSSINRWIMQNVPMNRLDSRQQPWQIQRTISDDAEKVSMDDESLANEVQQLLHSEDDTKPEVKEFELETSPLLGSPGAVGSNESITSHETNPQYACVICRTNRRRIVLLPCRHLCLCAKCANSASDGNRLKQCPMCRTPISIVVPVFP